MRIPWLHLHAKHACVVHRNELVLDETLEFSRGAGLVLDLHVNNLPDGMCVC